MEFSEFKLSDTLLNAIKKAKFEIPTPIQEGVIPVMLDGKDVLGRAQTGTGKTAAFILPILQYLIDNPKPSERNAPRVLVLAPTRELAVQIKQHFEILNLFSQFAIVAIFGGVSREMHIDLVSMNVDILIATPGRLTSLYDDEYIKFHNIEQFVLDEADKLLEMGFVKPITEITKQIPKENQRSFFSATLGNRVKHLSEYILRDAVMVDVTPKELLTTADGINETVMYVNGNKKIPVIFKLLKEYIGARVLIFTNTQSETERICAEIAKQDYKVDFIHGQEKQNQRINKLEAFRKKEINILVATDVAGRGLDIDKIALVINAELHPKPDVYVHRVGRTARAGMVGRAVTLCTGKEKELLKIIEKRMKCSIRVDRDHEYHSDAALFGKYKKGPSMPTNKTKTPRRKKVDKSHKSKDYDKDFARKKRR